MERFELAKQLAQEAGGILLSYFRKKLDVREKEGGSLVTEADERAENHIVDGIRHSFPDDSIVAEETGSIKGSSEYEWYIDPLDGTTNFVGGIPVFAVSIAVRNKDGLQHAAIYIPTLGWLLSASQNQGVCLNDARVSIRESRPLERARLLVSYARDARQEAAALCEAWPTTFRMLGSAVSTWAFFAAGGADALIIFKHSAWDCAAGLLMALEAGASVSDEQGRVVSYDLSWEKQKQFTLYATSPDIHEPFKSFLKTLHYDRA